MSYIYHQVTILAYKILIKNICIINIPYENKTIIISCKYIDKYINLTIHYQHGLKSNTMTQSYKYDTSYKSNINWTDLDVLFNCCLSRCIKRVSCHFILKSLVPSAKTEQSSKDTMLLQTNI